MIKTLLAFTVAVACLLNLTGCANAGGPTETMKAKAGGPSVKAVPADR